MLMFILIIGKFKYFECEKMVSDFLYATTLYRESSIGFFL